MAKAKTLEPPVIHFIIDQILIPQNPREEEEER